MDRSQPIFDRQFYSATVAENADAHTPIVTVTARSQLNRKLIYTIVGGNEHQTFAMEHEEGNAKSLKFLSKRYLHVIL